MSIVRFVILMMIPFLLAACDGADKKAQEDMASGNAQIDQYNAEVDWLKANVGPDEDYDSMSVPKLREVKASQESLIAHGKSAVFYGDEPHMHLDDRSKANIKRGVLIAEHGKHRIEQLLKERGYEDGEFQEHDHRR